jgi:hypothetical protein
MEPLAKDLISDDEKAMSLIADLKKQLEKMTAKYYSLEEECDLLAMENDRLRTLCTGNGVNPDFSVDRQTKSPVETGTGSSTSSSFGIAGNEDESEFLINAGGDDMYARSVGREIQNACGAGNVLCVGYIRFPTDSICEPSEYVLCGGVDKVLRLYSLTTGALLYELELLAPILAIDTMGALVACSMMDGSHAVVNSDTLHPYLYLYHYKLLPTGVV